MWKRFSLSSLRVQVLIHSVLSLSFEIALTLLIHLMRAVSTAGSFLVRLHVLCPWLAAQLCSWLAAQLCPLLAAQLCPSLAAQLCPWLAAQLFLVVWVDYTSLRNTKFHCCISSACFGQFVLSFKETVFFIESPLLSFSCQLFRQHLYRNDSVPSLLIHTSSWSL